MLTAAFTIISAATVAAIIYGRTRKVTVPTRFRWGHPPTVWIDPIHVERNTVEAAIKTIGKLGGGVGSIVDSKDSAQITIVAAFTDPGVVAATNVSFTPAGNPNKATIHVGPTLGMTRREKVNMYAHELAHALGYGHAYITKSGSVRISPPSGHLMHPMQEHMGRNTRGM